MNIGIVGAGKIVKEALPIMEQIPDIVFQSIVSSGRNPQNVEALQKQFNIKTVYEDYDKFLADENIDTIYLEELETLKSLAETHSVIIIEAITNLYLSNFDVLKQSLKEIGTCKIAQFNYSQYSSRYDNFKQGIIQPAFDPQKGGGALMDINVYNIHLAIGLFGMPKGVAYFANVENHIDTSGILQLDYDGMKVVCIGAKDSSSDNQSYIQGEAATIQIKGPTNELNEFELKYHTGGTQVFKVNQHEHRMYEEFVKITEIIQNKNYDFVRQQLEHSIHVIEVLELALDSASIKVGPSYK